MSAVVIMSPLNSLAVSLKRTASEKQHKALTTEDFCDSAAAILPFFDHLGPVFSVARSEFHGKLGTLREACSRHATLHDLVQQDIAAGRATVKNSCTRNLHRLLSAILFVKILFEQLMESPSAALRDAAGRAYEAALAPFHSAIVRGVVRAGLLTLPSREHFLAAIGETEESAQPRCEEVAASCSEVISVVSRLLVDIDFPASDVWFWPRS